MGSAPAFVLPACRRGAPNLSAPVEETGAARSGASGCLQGRPNSDREHGRLTPLKCDAIPLTFSVKLRLRPIAAAGARWGLGDGHPYRTSRLSGAHRNTRLPSPFGPHGGRVVTPCRLPCPHRPTFGRLGSRLVFELRAPTTSKPPLRRAYQIGKRMPVCGKPKFLGLGSKQTDYLWARRPKRSTNRLAMLIPARCRSPVRTSLAVLHAVGEWPLSAQPTPSAEARFPALLAHSQARS